MGAQRSGSIMTTNSPQSSAQRPTHSPASLEAAYLSACAELMNACGFFCDTPGEIPKVDRPTLLRVIYKLFAAVDVLGEAFDICCPAEPEQLCRYQPPPPSSPRRKA
jgi:hypothetical protein